MFCLTVLPDLGLVLLGITFYLIPGILVFLQSFHFITVAVLIKAGSVGVFGRNIVADKFGLGPLATGRNSRQLGSVVNFSSFMKSAIIFFRWIAGNPELTVDDILNLHNLLVGIKY